MKVGDKIMLTRDFSDPFTIYKGTKGVIISESWGSFEIKFDGQSKSTFIRASVLNDCATVI